MNENYLANFIGEERVVLTPVQCQRSFSHTRAFLERRSYSEESLFFSVGAFL